jgi:hypothetical protein
MFQRKQLVTRLRFSQTTLFAATRRLEGHLSDRTSASTRLLSFAYRGQQPRMSAVSATSI